MRKLFLLLALILIFPLVSGATEFYILQNENHSIKVPVDIDGSRLSGSGFCNISINYANSTPLVSDKEMTNLNNGYWNYTLTSDQTNTKGEYFARVECSDSGQNESQPFIYEVNPSGIRASEQRTESVTRSVYFIFGIGILFFILFLFFGGSTPMKWTFLMIGLIFFMIALNLLFMGFQDEVVNPRLETFFDALVAISFYMYWFLAGLLIIMWGFTFLNTWLYKKQISNINRFGEKA